MIFNKKRALFRKKITDVQNSIWELDFKIYKSRQLREESRLLRDRSIEQIAQVTAQLEGEKDKERKAKLQEELAYHTENKEKYEGQMKMVDEQVNGTEEQAGLLDTVKGLTELKSMYQDYVRKI